MFSQNQGSGLNAYRKVGVESMATSADPHQLVVMLFNGARAAIAVASGHMQRREIPAKCAAIGKAIDIIDGGLKASLDLKVGGELAQNLSDLYAYMAQRLVYANLKNDQKVLDEVATLLEQLGSAWEKIPAKVPSPALKQSSAVQQPVEARVAGKSATPAGATYAMPPGARAMPHEPAPARAAPPVGARPEAPAAKVAAPAAAPPPPDHAADANPRPINRVAAAYGVR